MKEANVTRTTQNRVFGGKKQTSLHPQTLRVRHHLAQWTKQGRKHWDLYRFASDPCVLLDALRLVLRNGGSPGIDGVSCKSVQNRQWEFVTRLSRKLRDGTYKPKPVKRVYIPKRDGRERPLGIPTLRDRTIQRALVLVMEPIYEQLFLPCSYGFRPGKSAPQCAADVAEGMFRRRYVIEADIESFFDRVVHRKLKGMLREQIVDPRVLGLIGAFLSSGWMELNKPWQETTEGTPQGGPLSPLLANIYLHYALDQKFAKTAQPGGHTQLYRYADDFVIVTNQPGRMRSVRRALHAWMREAGLKLKESKTREIDMSSHKRSRDSHLDFLGYRFHLRAFKDNPKRFWIARQPSEEARKAFRRKLKERLRPTLKIEAARQVIESSWRGWSGYFRYGNANHVLYREKQSIQRAVILYLRKKFRSQRRPVPWGKLFAIGKRLWRNHLPPRSIPHPLRQSEEPWAFA